MVLQFYGPYASMHTSSATSGASPSVSASADLEHRRPSSFANSLTNRLGVSAIVVSRWTGEEQWQVVLASESLTNKTSAQLIDSAEVAWRTGTPITNLASGQKTVLHSRPLPRLDGHILTVASEAANSQTVDESVYQLAAAESSVVVLEECLWELRAATKRDGKEESERVEPPGQSAPESKPSVFKCTRGLLRANWRQKLCVVLVVIGLCCLPWPHAIRCSAVVEPASRRFVNVPFDSRLKSVMVAPGDTVERGQLLARLDGSQLRNEVAALNAEHQQAQQRYRAALYQRDAAKCEVERLEVQRLENEIQRVERNRSQLEIRAPISGVVAKGDLEGIQGAALTVGQELYEIAPLDVMVIEVEVPESEVLFAQENQHVAFYLDAIDRRIESTITRVHPRNELRDTASVFVADVVTDNRDGAMRPGMHGTARVYVGYRTLAWIWLRKPIRTLRSALGVSLGW
ncbi:MAG TPA: hypothetical protein DDW52_02905 [Planctomycetaceae bacterium]|nr:hypothetical protein [Planctomycetaceae bacterium]